MKAPRSVWAILLLTGGVVGLGGLWAWQRRTTSRTPLPAPPPARELTRHEVERREGRLYAKGNTEPFAGLLVERYAEGQLQSRSVISNGLLEGLSEGWYTNGVLQVRESFRAGVADGLRTKWYPSGAVMSEAPVADGKIEGVFRRWHENGVLSAEVPMVAGEAHGISRSYATNGALLAEVRMEHGKRVERLGAQTSPGSSLAGGGGTAP